MIAKQPLSHPTFRLLLSAICFIIVLLPTVGTDQADADIGDSDRLGLFNFSWSPKWITRNLIVGEPIPVCSSKYPRATRIAVDRWNAALRIPAFVMSTNCDIEPRKWHPGDGVVSVLVAHGSFNEDETRFLGSDKFPDVFCEVYNDVGTRKSWACVGVDHMRLDTMVDEDNDQLQTYYGRAQIIMAPEYMWDDTRWVSLVRGITHELGHVLGLADYFCDVPGPKPDVPDDHPDRIDPYDTERYPNPKTLMNSYTARWACTSNVPTERDRSDYRTVYFPATVTDVHGTANGRAVTLTWDQGDVFVESHFEIQRASGTSGTNWMTVERSVPANATRFTLTDLPSGVQLYRVVAATLALCPKPAPEHCIDDSEREPVYGSPSNAASVAIQLPAPTGLRITNRTSSSLTLTWDTVSGADRYELRQTTPNANCEGDVQATATKPPHVFRNLIPDTGNRLCVRAKLSTNSAVTSAWADTEATISPVPRLRVDVSPRSASCYTGGSVSISWTISNGKAPYAVSVDGSSASGNRKTVTCQGTAGTQTVSVTATDASTPQRSGSASVSLAVANPHRPPATDPPLTISASASPTSCTTGGTVNVGWSASGGSGSYTVTVDGRSASTSPTSFTCQSTAGRQSIIVEVEDSNGSSALDTVYVTVTALTTCLSGTTAGTFLTYGSGCRSVQVSLLLAAVREVNPAVCAIRLWKIGEDGVGKWVQYGLSDGRVIPGSINFQVSVGAILWLSTCRSGSGVSGASDLEVPSCPDAVKPETGPAVIDADASSCITVRGGGALQISRGEYTLNVSLASDRDWFAFAPASYTGSSAGAFLFLDLTSGGWIALDPPGGFELERHIPADATGLPILLDAIAASASTPATE